MTDPEPGYITINPSVRVGYFNVVTMKLDGHGDYVVFRISEPLKEIAARALASSWSAATTWPIK